MSKYMEIAQMNLCSKDTRSPEYKELYFDYLQEDCPTPAPVPRSDCYCDNCFNGRDNLAVIIIDLLSKNSTL